MTTIPLNSRHDVDHDELMKVKDAAIREHTQQDVQENIEVVNLLIDVMAHAREEDVVDFSQDDVMRRHIDELYTKHPRVFGYEKTYCWKTKEERDQFATVLRQHYGITDPSDQTQHKPTPYELLTSDYVVSDKEADTPALLAASDTNTQQNNTSDAERPLRPLPPPETDTQQGNTTGTKPPPVDPGPISPPQPADPGKPKDVNLGLAFIGMQAKAFDLVEERINKLIDQLAHLNAVNKDLSDLLNALTLNKESKKADFSNDTEMQAIIDRLYTVNPKLFSNQKTYAWTDEKQIEVLLSTIDAEIKAKVAEVNQVTMFINVRFDERVQYSENARKVLEMLIRHCESIISKYHKT